MAEKRTILVCSCEDTMPLDPDAVRRTCKGTSVETARYLCRDQLDLFKNAVTSGSSLTVACAQEAPLFSEVAGDGASLTFVNVRETGGWSDEAAEAGPKMAALLAASVEPPPEIPFVSLTSDGVILIYGRDEKAVEAAHLLKDHLDVTVLITMADTVAPLRVTEFPVVRGRIRTAKGYLGAFELVVDGFAAPTPSSRGVLSFPIPRDGAVSRCDLLLDLSGNPALFAASDLRDGYLRADPGDPAAILRAILKARELVGTFDKPRYISFSEELCAHSRSKIVGCRRCLDLCPTGAIEPTGDHVAIDPQICAGCGQCAAACPTGAAAYALPPADSLMRKLRLLLSAYREAGGAVPVVLLHDEVHGAELIAALAHHGNGLPANVLPLAVNEVTQIGIETIAAAFAFGASGVRLLLREKSRHSIDGLKATLALAGPILSGLGFGSDSVATIETDDPEVLGRVLRDAIWHDPTSRPARFLPVGGKRDVLRHALRELHSAAPTPVDVIMLPMGAPFGTLEVNVEGCTLCLSCVSACPTGALRDDPERPTLRFDEGACVQCGLCKATCPEKVITLKPQIDFRATTAPARVIKQEEPFDCVRCRQPFGVKSTVERVIAQLEGKHWMYKGSAQRLDVIKMCENCRVAVMTESDFDPYGAGRANPRTTDDYLNERERARQEPDRNDQS